MATHPLADMFRRFALTEAHGHSPLYERLALAVADDPDLLALAGEAGAGQPAPNLLFGAVHRLLLAGDPHPLRRHYASLVPTPDTGDPVPAFRGFCLARAAALRPLLGTRRVQTNEVRRAAVILPALAGLGQPLALVEVGASAGLLLLLDRYAYDYGGGLVWGDVEAPLRLRCEARGPRRPPLPAAPLRVVARTGLEMHPLDPADPETALWLRALVWPEQAERAAALQAALAIAAREPPALVGGDALVHLADVLARQHADAVRCVVHAHAVNQFPAAARERLDAILVAAGREWPVHRIALEYPPGGGGPILDRITYDAGRRAEQRLARYDAHGGWIEWLADTDAADRE